MNSLADGSPFWSKSRRESASKILFWNCAHGVVSKIDFIQDYIASHRPVLFFISEAEIKNDKNYDCLKIPGYSIEVSKTIGHGKARSLVYVLEGSGFKRLEKYEDGVSEMIVMSNNKTCAIGVYRPFKTVMDVSRTDAFETLLKSLNRVAKISSELIIGGDWNVNWMSEKSNGLRIRLEQWSEENGLVQVVKETTRHQMLSTTVGVTLQKSCIDLVFQRTPTKVVVEHSNGSDHCLILVPCGIHRHPVKTKKLITTDWRNYSKEIACKSLETSLMDTFICAEDHVQVLFQKINTAIVEVCNRVIPKRVVRLRDKHEFENSRVEALKKKRDRVWKKYKKTGNQSHYEKSQALTKDLKRVIKYEKKRVFRAKMKSHGSKSFWRTIGQVFNNDSSRDDITLMDHSSKVMVMDKFDIAQNFASHFNNKIQDLLGRSSSNEAKVDFMEDNAWCELSSSEVLRAIIASKSKKSCGHDEIPMLVVKDCAEVLAEPLRMLFNKCLMDGWFPEDWKIAKIIPLHKKGSKTDVKNYRPVSNLCSLSKIFERCLLSRIDGYGLDDETQHGFRKGHGTVTAALEIQHLVATGLDSKKFMSLYTIDMSAAFDMLRPDLLDSKIKQMPMVLRRMIWEFLGQRRAFVSVGGENSEVFKIPVGVPQGSVLGPRLFSLYTNGLSEMVKQHGADIVVYADDSYVVCKSDSISSLERITEAVLTNHVGWLRKHGMIVNASKTELMHFGDATMQISCEDGCLVSSKTMNVLGITFDSKMSWEPQARRAMKNCQMLKPALRCLKTKLSKKELLQVITSNYFSRLYYGAEVWYNPLSLANKNRLSPVHYYPLRLATNCFDRKSFSRKFLDKLTQRAPPKELNEYKIGRLLYSITINMSPYALFQEVLSHAVIEPRKPENPKFLDMSRLKIGRQSFANRLNFIALKMSFNWLQVPMSPEILRKNLKSSFFSYYRQ
jgi:hypothetical protein